MPKCYTQQEKEQIRKRLHEEAMSCMELYGMKHTTVDELVKRVKIPKGTFYLFYKSKELLLFEVLMELHERVEQQLYTLAAQINPQTVTASQLTELLFQIFKTASEMPILNTITPEDVDLLARKLPPEILQEHMGHDTNVAEQLFAAFPMKQGVKLDTISAASRGIYFSTLHKTEIGESYDEGLRCLIRGLVMQIL